LACRENFITSNLKFKLEKIKKAAKTAISISKYRMQPTLTLHNKSSKSQDQFEL